MTNNKEEIGLWEKTKEARDIIAGANIAKDKLEGRGKSGYNEDYSLNKILNSLRVIALLREYRKVYEWVNNNIKEIVRIWAKEFGSRTITLWLYFIELRKEIHDCIQIKFGFNNVILNIREDAGTYRSYFTCSLINKTSPEKRVDINSPLLSQRGILEQFYTEFINKLPLRQLIGLTRVYPKFFSTFGPDGDPYLTVDLTFERGLGTYTKLFFDQRDRYPSYSYQPIYADQEREVCTIIVRPEECLNIDETIEKIEEMADCKRGDIRLLGRVEVEVDIQNTPYSIGPIAACEVIIKAIRYGGINNHIVRRYIDGCTNLCRMIEGSGASAIIKGKDKTSVQDDLDHHLSGMQNVALGKVNTGETYPISRNDFGFNEDIIYGDTIPIHPDLATHFQVAYQKFRQNKLSVIRYK